VHVAPEAIDSMVKVPFRIDETNCIATAGSSFAQHLAQRQSSAELKPLGAEPSHSMLLPDVTEAFGYGVFRARYSTISTARQLLHLFRRAYVRFMAAGPSASVALSCTPSSQFETFGLLKSGRG
jgi:hypothetical protein